MATKVRQPVKSKSEQISEKKEKKTRNVKRDTPEIIQENISLFAKTASNLGYVILEVEWFARVESLSQKQLGAMLKHIRRCESELSDLKVQILKLRATPWRDAMVNEVDNMILRAEDTWVSAIKLMDEDDE